MVGRTIGRYVILEQLGAGGMGVVYRARDPQLERDVALKFLTPSSATDQTARERLLREARSISALNHPNICQVFEIGREGDHDFIAMELVAGVPLKTRISAGPLAPKTAIRFGAQIAAALAHAHERGVVHRDLKSANVMVTPEGHAKVLDFGVAKREWAGSDDPHPEVSLTGAGMVVGTPAYFAPEVLRGDKSGPASDLWALGVVLYEMAAGALPFKGRTVIEMCAAIVNDEPARLPERLPNGFRGIVHRLLAKEPAHRYRSASEVQAALEAVDSDTGPTLIEARRRKLPVGAWIAGAALAAAVAVLVADGWGVRSALFGRMGSGGSGAPNIRSLAVLPLANLSGDPSQDYFADGMTEELITSLAPLPNLKLISRTSVMLYKGSKKSIPQIARELGVDGIVEGSVTRSGDRVRITAQLIDAPHDKHLWARSYERKLEEVLTLQREVAGDIAQEIRIQLTPQMIATQKGGHPLNTEAYELYLKGRYEMGKLSAPGLQKGIDYFLQAIALDPMDARFYSGLADAHVIQAQVVRSAPILVAMPKAKEAARKALTLDPSVAEAHTSYAIATFFVDWNFLESEKHAKRAIELSPGYSLGHVVYSVILGTEGRSEEAVAENRRALELDPLSLLNNWNLVMTLGQVRRFDEAEAQIRRGLELFPDSDLLKSTLFPVWEWQRKYPQIIAELKKSPPTMYGGKAFADKLEPAYEASGEAGYYRVWLEATLPMAGKHEGASHRLAQIYARLGDRDRAFAALERSLAERSTDMLWLQVDPDLDALRSDPRYPAFVRKVGFP